MPQQDAERDLWHIYTPERNHMKQDQLQTV